MDKIDFSFENVNVSTSPLKTCPICWETLIYRKILALHNSKKSKTHIFQININIYYLNKLQGRLFEPYNYHIFRSLQRYFFSLEIFSNKMVLMLEYFTCFLYYLLIIAFVCLFVVWVYFKYTYQYWRWQGVEYLKPTIFFGNMKKGFDGKTHVNDLLYELHNQIKGPFAGVYFVNQPALIIKDPELLRHILIKDFNNFMDRGVHSDGTDPLSLHLFRLSGNKWKQLRSKLSPVFTSGKLKIMFPTIIKTAEQLQNAVENIVKKEQLIDIRDICSRYTVDIISSTAFGVETNSFADPDNNMCTFIQNMNASTDQYSHILKITLSILAPELLVLFKQKSHSDHVIKFMFDVVRSVMDYRFTNKAFRKDFLQLLIQLRSTGTVSENDFEDNVKIYGKEGNNDILTFDELVAQAYVFIIAGYETSAVTMSNCLYELAKNPDIQKQVQEDIDNILSKHNGQFTYESIFEMEYLAAAVSETMRKYPPLGFLNRVVSENFKIPNSNIVLEKDMKIIVSVHGLHHDSRYFPNPDKFDPERFSPENKDKITPYSYLPFGDGPRHCIGTRLGKLQTMTGLAMILKKYSFEISPETPKKLNLAPGSLISVPKDKIMLLVTKRLN